MGATQTDTTEQWLGMAGLGQGRSSEQGNSSTCAEEVASVALTTIAGSGASSKAAPIRIAPPLPISMAKPLPTATARWRRKRPARSAANRRERTIIKCSIGISAQRYPSIQILPSCRWMGPR